MQLLMLGKCYKRCITVVTVEFHFPLRLFIFSIIGLLFNYPQPLYPYLIPYRKTVTPPSDNFIQY